MKTLDKFNSNLKMFWFFFRPYKRGVFGVLILMALSGAMESINLAFLYPLMTYGLKIEFGNHLKFLDDFMANFGEGNLILVSSICLIIVTILAGLTKLLYHYCSNNLVRTITANNQKNIFEKYIKSDYIFFVRNQQGRLVYESTIAIGAVTNILTYLSRIMYGLVACVSFMVLLFVLSWQVTLFLVCGGVLYVLFIKKLITNFINKASRLCVEENRHKNVILNEFIGGIKSIRIFQSLDHWKTMYYETVTKSVNYEFMVMMGRILPDTFVKFFFFIFIAIMGIFYSWQGPVNFLTMIPIMGTIVTVASRLFPYVNMIGNDVVATARYLPDAKIVYEALTTNTPEYHDGLKTCSGFAHEIGFDDVWFQYEGSHEPVLKGITVRIEKQKVTAIVGPSGSGKTTIVNLLLKLYKAKKGKITIDGEHIENLSNASYLSQFGYVGQETFIFNGTIKDNICFGRQDYSDEDVFAAAELANAHEFIKNTKDGYQTIVGDSGIKLSGGQRQRIAIARAMLRRPQILILDEATSSLDNISEQSIQDAINRISKHTTILIIAHRLSTVQKANKILVIDHGHIVEHGTHDELIGKRNKYYQLFTTAHKDNI